MLISLNLLKIIGARPMTRIQRVGVTTCCIDMFKVVSQYIVWRVLLRNKVNRSIKYVVAGRSDFWPPLAAVNLNIECEGVPYICITSTTHHFERRRLEKIVVNTH